MLDASDQRALVERLAIIAREEGCIVAPVGSVFYIFFGAERDMTKDLDAVVHDESLAVADTPTLERIAKRLGEVSVTRDGAVVAVKTRPGLAEPDLELVRGRRRRSGGFMPRKLLELAAARAERRDNLLLYPPEFILALKADAAVDREDRAKNDAARAEANRVRAEVFRSDVFKEVHRLQQTGEVDVKQLVDAIQLLKKNRQARVVKLLESTGLDLGEFRNR